jgi:predicted transcriptional regulator
MELQLSPERKAQLTDYAQRHGQDPAAVLDEIVADALDWERLDREEAVEGIRRGYADFKAGRVRSLADSFAEVREKHGLPR